MSFCSPPSCSSVLAYQREVVPQVGQEVSWSMAVMLRLSNSLHSPSRYAYHNYKEGLYEPARCHEGSDRSAGVATFKRPIGMKEEIESVLDDHS